MPPRGAQESPRNTQASPAHDDEPAATRAAVTEPAAFRAALAAIRPSIVKIETIGGALPTRRAGEGDQEVAAPAFRQADGPTTGVVWSAEGLIVTSSFNFMRDPSVITVTLADGRRLLARLVARDRPARLALLKVDTADLTAPRLAPRGELRAGQRALAAGWGFGGDAPAVSAGVVSAVRRISGLAVQTDAKVSPANYGGPLFDLDGRLIGVCVPMAADDDELAGVEWYDSGIGFAVASDALEGRVARLREGRDLQRGLLGVTFDAREIVVGAAPTTQPTDGLRVSTPTRGRAAEAGLREGDVVTAVSGEPVRRLVDLRRRLAMFVAGEPVEVELRRGAERLKLSITLSSPEELRATSQPTTREGP
ncbi:MAG: trypsin-like peptidase domain-containing protein [Phycisphaerae bacterium]